MNTAVLIVTVGLFAGQEAKTDEMTVDQAKEKVRMTLNASGSAIDGCADRYVKEQPTAKGSVEISVTIDKAGAVSKAAVTTGLEGARNLRSCLTNVAKGWSFPAPKKADQTFALKIPVSKGVKFYIAGPGEKPKAAPTGEKRDGFLSFTPQFRGPGE